MSRQTVTRIVLLALIAGAVVVGITFRDDLSVAALRTTLDDLGAWAPLAFMLAYAAAAVLFLPGSVFTIAGGVLFGPVWGSVYSLAGATVGATLAFLVARYAASEWVAQKSGGALKRLIVGVEREGWRFVAFTRLVPVFPFNLLNYALGLTRIPLIHYVIASLVCMAPGAVAYTYVGHAGAQAVAGGEGAIQAVLIALGLVAAVLFLPRLVRRIKQDPVPELDEVDSPRTKGG